MLTARCDDDCEGGGDTHNRTWGFFLLHNVRRGTFVCLFVCLFNGISTFVGYLMPNPFLYK